MLRLRSLQRDLSQSLELKPLRIPMGGFERRGGNDKLSMRVEGSEEGEEGEEGEALHKVKTPETLP
jgi:hypothetical protein